MFKCIPRFRLGLQTSHTSYKKIQPRYVNNYFCIQVSVLIRPTYTFTWCNTKKLFLCFYKSLIQYCKNRLLIQDGLENFNGCIRSNCQAAVAPIASHYCSAFTTIIINNLISADSLNANCKKDSATALLTDIHDYILGLKKNTDHDQSNIPINIASILDVDDDIIFEPESIDYDVDFIETEPMCYMSSMSVTSLCGTVCREILLKTDCSDCKIKMQAVENTMYPSAIFIENFKTLFTYASSYVPYFCHEKSLKKVLMFYLNKNVDCGAVGCFIHNQEIISEMKELTVSYCLVNFCKEINQLLHGKNKVLPRNPSFMHVNALEYRKKRSKIGKHSDKFKP